MADLSNLDKDLLKKAFYYYELEHASLVKNNNLMKIRTIMVDIAVIESKNVRLRHSEEKLGRMFRKLQL